MTAERPGSFPGSPAPAFKLQDENESWVTLPGLLASGPLMIVFYPHDFGSVCTKQLCAYQEAFDRFVAYGLSMAAISPNGSEDHQKFKARYGFAFHLLSDPAKEVFKAYGVTSLFMLGGASRAVFVIGKDGRIKYRYVEPTTLTHRRAEELLEGLDELRRRGDL